MRMTILRLQETGCGCAEVVMQIKIVLNRKINILYILKKTYGIVF